MSVRCIYFDNVTYVFIIDQDEELKKILGDEKAWIGTRVLNAQRKPETRRGPADRRLIQTCDKLNLSYDKTVALTLVEAFQIALHFKCLSISLHTTDATTDSLSIKSCWDTFRQLYKRSNILIDFGVDFAVFNHYVSLGWIVKSGENYGTDFLLYKKGPGADHAYYACIIITRFHKDKGDEIVGLKDVTYDWNALMAFSRVTQSVSKYLLLAIVDAPDISSQGGWSSSILEDPHLFIKSIRISSKTFTRHSKHLTTI